MYLLFILFLNLFLGFGPHLQRLLLDELNSRTRDQIQFDHFQENCFTYRIISTSFLAYFIFTVYCIMRQHRILNIFDSYYLYFRNQQKCRLVQPL